MRKVRERPVSAAMIKMMSKKYFTFRRLDSAFNALTFLLPEEKKVQKVYGGAHGANISAKESANDKCGSDDDERPKGPADDLSCCENSIHSQEWVKTQINICWKPIRKFVSGKNK